MEKIRIYGKERNKPSLAGGDVSVVPQLTLCTPASVAAYSQQHISGTTESGTVICRCELTVGSGQ